MKKLSGLVLIVALVAVACTNKTVHKNTLSPQLLAALNSGNDSIRMGSYFTLLDSLKANVYTTGDLGTIADTIDRDALFLLHKAQKYQQAGTGKNWIWDNYTYQIIRIHFGLMLDMFGYINTQKSNEILKGALKLEDNNLKLFAALSLIRLDEKVAPEVLENIAADDEDRLPLSVNLLGMQKGGLFPDKYNTQELLAQSDMVIWLIYPTELGRTPDEIAFEKKQRVEENGEQMDYYLFKFRSTDTAFANDGWMAGVSGGYLVKDEPTPYAMGSTFSSFEKWEAKTPEQHLESITGLLDKAYKQQTNGKYNPAQ